MSDRPDNHPHYAALLERHIDGDLSPSERMELFDHLENCERCQQVLEAEERLQSRLKQIPRLVAPSDLRASILRQATREQYERSHALNEDPRFAPVFETPPDEELEHDVPVFENVPRRVGVSRARRRARRYSAVFAMMLLVVASIGTLFTADFSAIPPLHRVQQVLYSTGERTLTMFAPHEPVKQTEVAKQVVPTPEPLQPDRSQLTQRSAWISGYIAGRFDQIASRVQRFADAAARSVPQPAESASPQLAAVVIRCTGGEHPYSFAMDEFADTVRQTAETQLDGHLSASDQFAYQGQRYRCYTLEVAEGRLETLIKKLSRFRAPHDGKVLQVLGEQGKAPAGEVAFYTADQKDLLSTFKELTVGDPHAGRGRRRLDFVLMD